MNELKFFYWKEIYVPKFNTIELANFPSLWPVGSFSYMAASKGSSKITRKINLNKEK